MADREKADEQDENPANHPGSRYGTAAEDRPDLDPEVPPVVVADVKPEDIPTGFAGAMPENAGRDDADVTNGEGERAPGKTGRSTSR